MIEPATLPFRDRTHAGRVLSAKLNAYENRLDVVVLALPRGGIPVAAEVARYLRVPLDVFVVRKLGVPGHEELAMGAIGSGGVRVINHDVVRQLGVTDYEIERETRKEQQELVRHEKAYRGHAKPLRVRDQST